MARLRADDLERLGPLLAELRRWPTLRERSPGTFTWRGGALLHFHSFTTGLVADVKAEGAWLRYPVGAAADRRTLLRDVRRVLRGDTAGLAGRPT
jgi:hypothetical protein